MSEAGAPNYASLSPANPAVINGMVDVELSSLPPLDYGSVSSPASNSSSGGGGAEVASPSPTPEVKPDSYYDMDKSTMIAVIQFLKRENLKTTEDTLRRECGFFEPVDLSDVAGALKDEGEVLSSYKSDGNPADYFDAYKALVAFVEKSLDVYKHEIGGVLYPVLAHMYLELTYNYHKNEAYELMTAFSGMQEEHHQEDLRTISLVNNRSNMTGHPVLSSLLSGPYTIRISKDSLAHLKRFLSDRSSGTVPRIIQNRLKFDEYEGVPRSKAQVMASQGGLTGEAMRSANKIKIFYGLLKEPEVQSMINEEEDQEEESDKPKKKKQKKDLLNKNKKNDPNAPPSYRIPLPELRDQDKLEKARIYKDSLKRVNLSKDNLPSVCFYTFLNAASNVSSVEICDDSSLLAYGVTNSSVVVQSITPSKLKVMKPADQLTDIDKDTEDVMVRMLDERNAETQKNLHGHSGCVTSVSISPDRTTVLTASIDGTVRLWSTHTWTCVVIFRGHMFAVWSVKFSPHGYYFISGGQDRTARLWATDQPQPLRIFAGHYSDVDVVEFHPNSNYIATGSSDRCVRVWDCSNGTCVRILTGHKGKVSSLCFSPCGRYLASGGADAKLLVWDMSNCMGQVLACLSGHTNTIHTIAFSREGAILASGGLDCSIKLWDFSKLTEEGRDEEISHYSLHIESKALLISTFYTKQTPVLNLHFTRRNVLLGAGPYMA